MEDTEITVPDDARAELCREMGAAFRFAASLFWPGEERRQKEAVATWAATVMGLCDVPHPVPWTRGYTMRRG